MHGVREPPGPNPSRSSVSQPLLAPEAPNGARHRRPRRPSCPQASHRFNTRVALVPPNPKLFDITQLRLGLSSRFRTMGTSANSESSSSILALSQMKPLFIMSSEKIASCTPTAPNEWPVRDLVEEIGGMSLPNT